MPLLLKQNSELLKFIVKRFLEKIPSVYIKTAYGINKFKNYPTNRIISENSTVCIEGFPRCANSFAYTAFPMYTGKKENIATHLHSSAQIIEAIKLNIPTIVLIRKPDDCILSLRALALEDSERRKIEPVLIPVQYDIKWFISFYESIMTMRSQFVIATFDDVVKDFNIIIKKYNDKYGTLYPTNFDHKQLEKTVFEASAFHLSPSPRRNDFKELVKNEFYAANMSSLVKKANDVYNKFIT